MSDTYVAFISYSHRDSQWARWVQRSLENYRLPTALASQLGIPRKLGKVFRDREELSTGQNLGDHLTAALDASKNLIVICSSRSKASPWVANEIKHFKASGKTDRIFCLLVDGGAEAFPEPVLTDAEGIPLEPLAADPRKEGDGKRLAKLKLISGIVNTNLDQLAQREKARRQRLLLTYANAALIIGGVFLFLEQARQNEAKLKAIEVQAGIDNVATMTNFFKKAFNYVDMEILSDVTADFGDYLERFPEEDLNNRQKLVKAEALRLLSRAELDLGDLATAEKNIFESRALYWTAARASPQNIDLAIEAAFADFYAGNYFIQSKQFDRARGYIQSYADQIQTLTATNPNHPVLVPESVYAPTALLKLELDANTRLTPTLEEAVKRAVQASESALDQNPKNIELLTAADAVMAYSADAFHKKSCHVFSAQPFRERAVEYSRSALQLDPKNRRYSRDLSNSLSALANGYMTSANPVDAIPAYLEAYNLQNALLEQDPENQQLISRQLIIQLELLAVQTYHPDVFSTYPAAIRALEGIELEATRLQAREIGTRVELMWLIRRAHHHLSNETWDRAADLSGAMRDLASESSNALIKDYYGLTHALHHAVISEKTAGEPPTPALRDYLAINPSFPQGEDIDLSESESCQTRLVSWATSALRGDIETAAQKAQRDWALGSRGLEMAFFSELLDIPFPSAELD